MHVLHYDILFCDTLYIVAKGFKVNLFGYVQCCLNLNHLAYIIQMYAVANHYRHSSVIVKGLE